MSTDYAPGVGGDAPLREYQGILGSLQWAATHTRPDIAFATSHLGSRLSCPKFSDRASAAALRVVSFLIHTADRGIRYLAGARDDLFVAHVDADFAEGAQRKSRSAHVLYYAGAPLVWASRLQSVTAMSTNDAELIALADACREFAWVFFFTLPLLPAAPDFEFNIVSDSAGALCILRRPSFDTTRRSKHLELRFFYA